MLESGSQIGVPENTFEVTVRPLDCTDMRSTHCLKEFPLSHKTHEAVKARRHGCFIGLAVGDALGPTARATKITFLGDLEQRLMMSRSSENGSN